MGLQIHFLGFTTDWSRSEAKDADGDSIQRSNKDASSDQKYLPI
jgi:hypothetical protein